MNTEYYSSVFYFMFLQIEMLLLQRINGKICCLLYDVKNVQIKSGEDRDKMGTKFIREMNCMDNITPSNFKYKSQRTKT